MPSCDVASVRGTHTIPIEEWYAGPGRSHKERDKLLVKIRIPRSHYEGFTGYYFKYGKRNALEITTMGCCCLVKLAADKSTIEDIRLAFGVAGPTPMRALAAEDAVRGLPVGEAVEKIGELAAGCTNPRRLLACVQGVRPAAHQGNVEALPYLCGAQGRG